MTRPTRAAHSAAIVRRLLQLPQVRHATRVMGYLPMQDELDTRPFLSALIEQGQEVYVPRTIIAERRLEPVRLRDVEHVCIGAYGIAEPAGNDVCLPQQLDFILVPARAFDRNGNRLGRGAGFYDRFMAIEGFTAVRCGAAFSCQLMPAVPHGDHDLPVHILVTENETLHLAV